MTTLLPAEYKIYLRSSAWAEKREAALEAAGRRCAVCGLPKKKLQVHHRTYKRLGAELPEDLVVLCPACHISLELGRKQLWRRAKG